MAKPSPSAFRRWKAAVYCCVGLFFLSCDALKPPSLGICGNHIVEPEQGEACDDLQPSRSCGAPESAAGCQPLCDRDDPTRTCPSRYQCGQDGVCRTPSLTFPEAREIAAEPARQLLVGDFNGDGRDDLASLSAAVKLRTFDADLNTMSEYRNAFLQLETTDFASVGSFTLSGRDDLVVPVEVGFSTSFGAYRGIQALRGQPQGTLESAFVPHRVKLPDNLRLLFRTEFGAIVLYDSILGYWPSLSDDGADETITLPHPVESLIGTPATYRVGGCAMTALTYQGENRVRLYSLMLDRDANCAVPPASQTIQFDSGLAVGGVWAGDVDGDSHLDLMISAGSPSADPASYATHIAYGRADLSFASAPEGDLGAVVGRASDATEIPPPLATGDLNGDGRVDAVYQSVRSTESGGGWALTLMLSRTEGEFRDCEFDGYSCDVIAATNITLSTTQAQWSQAVFADTDGDSLTDLVVSEAERPSVLIFPGTGQPSLPITLPPRVIETQSPVKRFAVASVGNEDAIPDLLLAEPVGDRVSWSVAYGNVASAPSEVVALETFDRLSDICPGSPVVGGGGGGGGRGGGGGWVG
jgi:hypothetical protein